MQAGRQVKRVLQQQQAEQLAAATEAADSEEEEAASRAPFNPFDLLGDEEGTEDILDQEDAQGEAEASSRHNVQAAGASAKGKKGKKVLLLAALRPCLADMKCCHAPPGQTQGQRQGSRRGQQQYGTGHGSRCG